jgi:two-component system, chemotaxis family, protein-glutamate methylesterase/glutaminase
MTRAPIRVLVADDSAFARKVIREVLSSDPQIEVVGTARDGLDALEKIAELRPDVVTLDLLMPLLDGLGVLHALRGKSEARCVVVSTSDEQSALAIQALEAGALDIVHKPTALATDRLYELSSDLVQKVKIAALARRPLDARDARQEEMPPQGSRSPAADGGSVVRARSSVRVVVIGASTGGPQALTRILASLPREFPVPIAVVLHMPIGYTKALAMRLNDACSIDVFEAHDGGVVKPGQAVIARAGMHMRVDDVAGGIRTRLGTEPLHGLHCPAVDVLFSSAAEAFGSHVVAAVLTGMGEDGLQGAAAIHEAGGKILTEAESSCIVYGMPRAVFEGGLNAEAVALDAMSAAIQRLL